LSQLILASSSPHRATLLKRLGVTFDQISPEIDESPHDGELPHQLAARLAFEKAQAIAAMRPGCFVLGSDQVAVHGSELVGKPGNAANALSALRSYSGQTVQFLTGVALIRDENTVGEAVVETRVTFRTLGDEEIERYVEIEKPFECAGSFRAEKLGISLFESLFSQDPTAIIGLPLIETGRLLREAGFQIP
jgi:septum formation protein